MLAGAADVATTLTVLHLGGQERNPLLVSLVQHPPLFVALKVFVLPLLVAPLVHLTNRMGIAALTSTPANAQLLGALMGFLAATLNAVTMTVLLLCR
jgi:hypothetical protein